MSSTPCDSFVHLIDFAVARFSHIVYCLTFLTLVASGHNARLYMVASITEIDRKRKEKGLINWQKIPPFSTIFQYTILRNEKRQLICSLSGAKKPGETGWRVSCKQTGVLYNRAMSEDYLYQIKTLVLDEETFVRLVLKGQSQTQEKTQAAESNPWRQVIVRPVLLKNGRHLQFSYFSQKQDITKNYRNGEAEARLDEVLALPFQSMAVQSTTGEKLFQITKKGKAILHKSKVSSAAESPNLAHDASKQLALPAGRPDAFLQATGVMDGQGHVRPSMHGKFSTVAVAQPISLSRPIITSMMCARFPRV
jgi:hypothetical protein